MYPVAFRPWAALGTDSHERNVVALDRRVGCNQGEAVALCLRDQQTVERVSMVWWKPCHGQRVRIGNDQFPKPAHSHAVGHINDGILRQWEFAQRVLYGDLPSACRGQVALGRGVGKLF